MREQISGTLFLRLALLFSLCLNESLCIPSSNTQDPLSIKGNALSPSTSPIPSVEPQPFLPLLAPSPLTPFTNMSLPVLSGLCTLNFSSSESILSKTATDCWTSFAPYLANVVCCPQFDANLVILMGQSSKNSRVLALNETHAKHCLSDVVKILEGQGANTNLPKLCSIHSKNLTAASCPVTDVDEFESTVDSSRLLAACEKIDLVNECCDQVCQNAMLDAARKIASNGINGAHVLPEQSSIVDDCKHVVLRWLASKLDPSSANRALRGLSNCKVNKVCPLAFPNMTKLVKECGDVISNKTACCKSMESYVSHLQEQSFLTNLQALNCAASLGMKLQKANVSNNLYELCRINLKDFSLQVGSQDSGCLLPSLPSDATYESASGVSFLCDLNDNIGAPWPSKSSVLASSCNKTTKLPALPAATSSQTGLGIENLVIPLLFASLILQMLI